MIHPALSLGLVTMPIVALYILCTAPFLPLLLYIHRLQSAYTGVFIAALVLQLIPIGLVFFPLGFIGVAMLAYTLVATARRNHLFRLAGIDNLEVARRWTQEYIANLIAFGFALDQKGVALVFIQVTSRQGFAGLWEGLLPASAILWLLLVPMIHREWRRLGTYANTTTVA